MSTLIVGCGRKIKAGCVNLDCFTPEQLGLSGFVRTVPEDRYLASTWKREDGTEFVQFDLNVIKNSQWHSLPFKTEEFSRVDAEDVLEHCLGIVPVVNELGRVLKIGGILWIRGPHWNHPEAIWDDPTHLRAFTPRTFAGWVEGSYDYQHYGYYMHQGKVAFKQLDIREVNRGLEITLERIK